MSKPKKYIAPLPKGERPTDLERARGPQVNTSDGKGGVVQALPRKFIGPHGLPPKGLSDHERGIWFHEGWGSVETRSGVLWDREYRRRMKAEAEVYTSERDERFGVDVTPADDTLTDRVAHIWSIRGIRFNARAV